MILSKKHNALVVKSDKASMLPSVIEGAHLSVQDSNLAFVPFSLENCQRMKNLGVRHVISPIETQYEWPGRYTPYAHQRETSAFCTLVKRGFILNGLGSGKSLSALWAADYLMNIGEIRKAVIMSPISTLERVWGDTIYLDMLHRKATVLYGTAARRKKLFAHDFDFYIINHDGFQVIYEEIRKRDDIDLLLIDEAAAYRNSRTNRWKLLRKYIREINPKYVWAMTGTPTPNAPTDAYGLAALLGTHDGTTFTRFREATMQKVSQFVWVPRQHAAHHVAQILQPSIRYATEDCIDLPPTVYQTRSVQLSKQQTDAMKTLAQNYVLALDAGAANAVNEADMQSKLLQCSTGFLYGRDASGQMRISQRIEAKERIDTLMECIEEAPAKVIVFVPFIELINIVHEEISKRYTCECVHGAVAGKRRDNIFYNFQHECDPRVLIAYPSVMAHGLTLTSAATIVWYAPYPSNEVYEQANGRIVRPSQTRTTNIIHIEGSPVERKLYKRLKNRQSLQGLVLETVRDMADWN